MVSIRASLKNRWRKMDAFPSKQSFDFVLNRFTVRRRRFFQEAFKHSQVIDWFMKLGRVCTPLSLFLSIYLSIPNWWAEGRKNWTKMSFSRVLMRDLRDEIGWHKWKVNAWFLSRRGRIAYAALEKPNWTFFFAISEVFEKMSATIKSVT